MKPVHQTTFGPDGNCYAACVASILEIPLEEVPDVRGDGWGPRLNEWLAGRGWEALFFDGGRQPLSDVKPGGYAVAGILIMPSMQAHAVVCLDGVVVHDPHGRPLWCDDSPVLLWTVLRKKT